MKSFSGFVTDSDHFRPACLLRAALAFDLIVMMHIELGKLPRYTRTELVLVIISEPFSKKKVYWGWLTGKDGCETKLRMNLEFQWHRCWWKIRNTLKTQLLCQMWEAQGLQKRRRQNGIAWLVSPSAHSKHAGQCHCYERESSWASSYAWVQGLQDINQTVWAFWVRNDNGFHWKTGDEGGISDVTVEGLTKEVLPVLLASYQPNDIFSCDEIAMFFKVLLNCTYNLKGKKCIYRKTTEELVAALLWYRWERENESPRYARYQGPKCFPNNKSLPCTYKHSAKAWMASTIFETFMKMGCFASYKEQEGLELLLCIFIQSFHRAYQH